MKKIKTLLLTLVATFAFWCAPVYAETTSAGGYTITKYNVDIDVHENNVLDITEDITVYFTEYRHGIFRTIPVHNHVVRNDGTTSNNRAKITNIAVSEQYDTSRDGDNLEIKIGDPDKTIIGEKTYRITYSYDLGKDRLKDADEFYFNIFGTGWDVNINNASFRITMPKEFDEKKLGFSRGVSGSTDGSDISYYVDDNEISGYLSNILRPREALTIRMELPEGYFVNAGSEPSNWLYILYALPIVFFIISFHLWKKYGKDDKTFINPEYSAPKGCNSLDVGFFHKGRADSTDVLSLLVYLANKGYLRIEEIKSEKKSIFKAEEKFKLIKVKKYDGKDENEKMFLEGLFESGNEVTRSDLYNKFYRTTNKIISNRNDKKNKREILEKTGLKQAFAFVAATLSFIFAVAPAMIDYNEEETLMLALVWPFYLMVMAFALLFGVFKGRRGKTSAVACVVVGVIIFAIALLPLMIFVLPIVLLHITYTIGFVVDIVMFIAIIICALFMPKRTKYGLEMYAKTEGFRQFLESVEKDRIEKMVEENPNCFYDILPFTYTFGISDKWIEKFEDINLQAPDWYSGTTAFSVVSFGSFMDSTMTSAASSMSSSSGGGGSAGGGSGGGGGGSW